MCLTWRKKDDINFDLPLYSLSLFLCLSLHIFKNFSKACPPKYLGHNFGSPLKSSTKLMKLAEKLPFLHIWRYEPSCWHKQQHQPVPITGIMYALIIIPVWSSNLFGLSEEQQFQRKNHEGWLDKAQKLRQNYSVFPTAFSFIFIWRVKTRHSQPLLLAVMVTIYLKECLFRLFVPLERNTCIFLKIHLNLSRALQDHFSLMSRWEEISRSARCVTAQEPNLLLLLINYSSFLEGRQ